MLRRRRPTKMSLVPIHIALYSLLLSLTYSRVIIMSVVLGSDFLSLSQLRSPSSKPIPLFRSPQGRTDAKRWLVEAAAGAVWTHYSSIKTGGRRGIVYLHVCAYSIEQMLSSRPPRVRWDRWRRTKCVHKGVQLI